MQNHISLIKMHISSIYELIIDPHNEKLSVGLLAQLIEHCIAASQRCVLLSHSGLNFSGLSITSA